MITAYIKVTWVKLINLKTTNATLHKQSKTSKEDTVSLNNTFAYEYYLITPSCITSPMK